MPEVAIVDYGMGNLFSVNRACAQVGLDSIITDSAREIAAADAVILPGVGAFGDAMTALRQRGLVDVLREAAAREKPLLGICLGMQLLMSVSEEFGRHEGLGIIEGEVIRLTVDSGFKVPHVGWNQLRQSPGALWQHSLLNGLADGEFMYFVHSFCVKPKLPQLALATTHYGTFEFCSSLAHGQVFACQFHPERSGRQGLQIYRNFAVRIKGSLIEAHHR